MATSCRVDCAELTGADPERRSTAPLHRWSRVPPSLPQPERDRYRLNRLHNRGGDHRRERLDVELVAEPPRKGGDGPLGIVASPVEAPVDRRLDPSPERLEECRHDERGGGDRERVGRGD